MNRDRLLLRYIAQLTVLGASLAVPTLTFAQNCALCYTQAAASGSRMIQALRSGIAFLVIPPMAICIILTVMAYKKNNQFDDKASFQAAPNQTNQG